MNRTPRYTTYPSAALIAAVCFFLLGLLTFQAAPRALETIDTEYFTIIYDSDGAFTAGEIAKFCDDVYRNLMARYDGFSDNPRVACIVNDSVDLANGFAQYYQNTITIYATNMDFELRGQSEWLRNVFVHEMTHMVALKKAAHGPINLVTVGGGRYDRNPDYDIGVAWYHLSQPVWFSEGTAQLGAETYGSDRWDTHRDMLLRAAWYEGSLLSEQEMNVLDGRTGIEAEMVYNQGYNLVRYIRDRWGYDKVVALNNRSGYFDFGPTVKDVLGVSYETLCGDWRNTLDSRYGRFRKEPLVSGEIVQDRGSMDYFPAVSPDGRRLAWLSNSDRDYAITDLMLTDLETGETHRLVKDVDYRVSWSRDSSRLVYVRRPDSRPNFYDIYTWDIAENSERRLSQSMRAKDPAYSPDGSRIVFVKNEGGNNTLALVEADGTDLRFLTNTGDGIQFYRPSFSPDGSEIVFGIYRQGQDRDIAVIGADSPAWRHSWDIEDSTSAFSDTTSFADDAGFRLIVATTHDDRDPVWLPDGGGIMYASDRTGVFNLYRLDLKTNRVTRATNVYGGAFTPSVALDGMVYYAGYTSRNYSIFRVPDDTAVETGILAPLEERDYLVQPKPFVPDDHFPREPFVGRRILNAVVPTLNLGPSFIGSSFGLQVLDVGAEAYVSDLLGRDALAVATSLGKNLHEDVPLNNSFQFTYQRKLYPLTSSTYTHSPTFFVQGYRSVIHNHIGRFEGDADSVFVGDLPEYGYEDVLGVLNQHLSIADRYRHEFRIFGAGMFIPLGSRHALVLDAGIRHYLETLIRQEIVTDRSRFLVDGADITGDIPGAGDTFSSDTNFFRDLAYFKSRELSLGYQYYRAVPAADDDLLPRGSSFFSRVRHMRTTVADSLVPQVRYQVPVGMYSDGYFALATYQPDPYLDEYRPLETEESVNEYTVVARHGQGLPFWRHVVSGLAFVGYRDVRLKDAAQGEGSGYNWPLKYYLGGRDLMSGYPYFAFWGSKIAYGRLDYTVPLPLFTERNLLGFQVQRMAGTVFFEAGAVWNFARISMDRIRDTDVIRDIGIECRLKTIVFYRLPMYLSATVSWPLDGMGNSPYANERDARRYYISLRM